MKNKNNLQLGQVSRMLLVLAIIILVAVVITYLVMRMAQKPAAPTAPITTQTVPLPDYEKQLGNIRFVFESSINRQNVLRAVDIKNSQYNYSYQKDYPISNPGATFIQVTVGAQNKGTINIEQSAWDLGDIVDSKGRHFVSLDSYAVTPWLPNPNLCGALLKPAFDPTPCTKIYEVSKESTGLKINIVTGVDNIPNNLSSGKTNSFLLDLIIK